MRCLYVDLDGTLLGPGASLLRGADGRFSALGVRALEACSRADVEVVLYSAAPAASVFESARLIGSSSYIFELGCGLVLDGELEWLTGGLVPVAEAGSIYDQIEASGAPALLLERFAGQLEYHTPWSVGREVSHLFRGAVDLDEVRRRARPTRASTGCAWSTTASCASTPSRCPACRSSTPTTWFPAAASKARAVARHMQARGYTPEECIAVGDSREDMDAASRRRHLLARRQRARARPDA